MMMKFFLPRSFFEKPSHFFFVYALRAFESNERSRRRFDAIAQRKSAGFVRLLHRFSMDGWMDARASFCSFFLSLSLSLPLSLRANFISLTLSLSLFRPSFLPKKQTKTSFENNKIQSKSLARRKSPRRRRSSRSLTTKKKGRTMTRTRRPRPVVVASNPG